MENKKDFQRIFPCFFLEKFFTIKIMLFESCSFDTMKLGNILMSVVEGAFF
jgi:hypothetical protein